MRVDFEWRASKAEANAKKHGVGFGEALTVFADPLARIFDDPDHSADESREIIVGHSSRQRLLMVSFTARGGRVRIISARVATKRERHDYEQGSGSP
ncbi:MAG: BrnT family toxin [Acidobacteria bacterium]|nr:BrnT family toxin [Acidobacteriota bacterium]